MGSDEREAMKKLLRSAPKSPIKTSDLLRTGSTLLDLSMSGKLAGGFCKGHYYLLVGDSASGKTWITMTALAEATISKHFDDYLLIRDDTEHGALMDLEYFFGKKLTERLEIVCSETTQDFYDRLSELCRNATPFIYVLDSENALWAPEEDGDEEKASYGTAKAKSHSRNIRKVVKRIEKTGSILIVTSQTRDNIGPMSRFKPKTRSGGRAITFFATEELWTSHGGRIYSTGKIRGKKRQLGVICKVKIEKSRKTGRLRTVEIPIYHSVGIDDVGSCIEYLIDEGHWKGKGSKVEAEEFEYSGTIDKLARMIEESGQESKLRNLVAKTWNEIEEACMVHRKNRYGK